MAVPTAYLTSTKNLGSILAAMQRAEAPSRFTYDFLKQLGFASSGNRPLIPLLKALKFIDDGGTPLDRYRRFKDATLSKRVMAEGIRDAYSDVLAIDPEAHKLTNEQLRGVFARLSGKGDSVTEKMALTFKALAGQADFSSPVTTPEPEPQRATDLSAAAVEQPATPAKGRGLAQLQLHHDIHIHLPASTEIGVYDAIFKALRQNFSE
jgi:hypothetical protein